MKVTQIAARTTWTPDQIKALPWRYRQRVLSCFGLLDEVGADQARTRQLLRPENLPAPR